MRAQAALACFFVSARSPVPLSLKAVQVTVLASRIRFARSSIRLVSVLGSLVDRLPTPSVTDGPASRCPTPLAVSAFDALVAALASTVVSTPTGCVLSTSLPSRVSLTFTLSAVTPEPAVAAPCASSAPAGIVVFLLSFADLTDRSSMLQDVIDVRLTAQSSGSRLAGNSGVPGEIGLPRTVTANDGGGGTTTWS